MTDLARVLPRAPAGIRPGVVLRVLTIALLAAAAVRWAHLLVTIPDHRFGVSIGVDFAIYRDATARWLAGGPFYAPYQLAGPYDPWGGPSVLYPPSSLLLFVPFQVLPAVLWWVLPLGALAVAIRRLAPAPWTWPILALLVFWPRTQESITWGNPAMWVTAAFAWGLIARWPAAFVLLKPSLGFAALIGIRHRGWWVVAVALGVAGLALGLAMWIDWITAVRNAKWIDLGYSLAEVPFLALPAVAWLGRRRPSGLEAAG